MNRQDLIRFTLARLDTIFPHKDSFTPKEVANFLGNSETTVRKYLSREDDGSISKDTLAQYLIQERV